MEEVMRKIIIFGLISLFFCGIVYAQNDSKGPLIQLLQLDEEARELYSRSDFKGAKEKWEEALKILEQMKEIAINTGNEELEKLTYKLIAHTLTNLGVVYDKLCDYQKAIKYYEDALKIHKELDDKQGIRADLGNLGVVYSELGDYSKAIKYYEEAMEIAKQLDDKEGVSANLGNLGKVYYDLGNYSKAIKYHEDAMEIHKQLDDKKGISDDLTNLGNVYDDLGDYPKAIKYHEDALKIHKELDDKQGISYNLTNLGVIYKNLGDYSKAIKYYEEAMEIAKELDDKKVISNNLTNLGNIYSYLGDYSKAIKYHEDAMEIHKQLDDKKGISDDLTNLGVVYYNLGDYSKAIKYYEDALEIRKEIGVPTGVVRLNIADVYLETGKIDEAEKIYSIYNDPLRLGRLNLFKKDYNKAIEYFDKSLKEDLESRDAELLFASYVGLGHSYLGLKDYQKAKEYYEKAITMAEEQREELGEGEKSKFFSANVMGFYRTEPYEGIVRALINLDGKKSAFYYSENLKARVLAESIARSHSSIAKTLPADLAEEEQNYIIKIRGLKKEMEVLYKNKAMDIYAEKEKELNSVKAEQAKFINKLRNLYPEYASINYPQPIGPQNVSLLPDEVLCEFEVTEGKTYLFLLNGKDKTLTIKAVPISRADLEKLVLEYRNYFENIEKYSDLAKYDAKIGNKLYQLLFGKSLDNLPQGTSLIIVPDEILGILPFESLVTFLPEKEKIVEGKYGPFPVGVQYLGDKFDITYAQSATSLTMLRSLKKGKSTEQMVLAVCDPVFSVKDKRAKELAKTETDKQPKMMGAIINWKKMGVGGVKKKGETVETEEDVDTIFPRLEKTREIAESIKTLFTGNSTVLIGPDAKEEEVVKLPLEKYRYITFATHGILDKTVPYIQEPALVLSQVGNGEGYDGFLTMSEVMGLKMSAEVVALTACQTGVGKNVSGEGVMGMGRAFQYAGCGNVLMSLWSVEETATVNLANKFFKNLKEGKSTKSALRLARSEIRKSGYEHPFYWSAFILVGR